MIKKILITQRVDKIKNLNETRESIDIRLLNFCLLNNFIPITISSFVCNKYELKTYLDNINLHGIILSGGNNIGELEERDLLESKLIKWSKYKKIPLIGICRGLQMINHYQKGSLIPITGHCKTRHYINGEQFPLREVNSYHNYGIFKENLGDNLLPIAFAEDGSIEAIKHETEPWLGIMWHPEREEKFNKNDLKIFYNHFNQIK